MMNHSPIYNASIERVLVVVDPGVIMLEDYEQPEVLQRALGLANATGCELELFAAYHEPTLELSLFANQEEVSREKDRLANSAATRLGEIALDLRVRGAQVSHELRWDTPYADALLRKISEADPDIVMKQTDEPSYVLGLTNNPDWELIRKSPAHLWFVKPGMAAPKAMLTAIGGTDTGEGIISPSDYKVFRFSETLARSIGVKNLPVHTFETPKLHAYAGYEPMLVSSDKIEGTRHAWAQAARLHGQAIDEFAEHFHMKPEQIEIMQGHAADVIPELARSKDAGLVVMGARNLGRLERLFQPVSAEPVLSTAPCDIVFVKETRGAKIPETSRQPRQGVPLVNLEMAITHPDKVFESPEEVVEQQDLTVDLRQRILDAWELDVSARLKLVDEGGPVEDAPACLLREIHMAKESLSQADL